MSVLCWNILYLLCDESVVNDIIQDSLLRLDAHPIRHGQIRDVNDTFYNDFMD